MESFNIEPSIRYAENGMRITVLPKHDFFESVGVISVGLGSIHNMILNKATGNEIIIPNGSAHFIEHLIFKRNGPETYFDLFADDDAVLNAYTTMFRTNFVFSTTTNLKKNLLSLFDLVFSWFADEKSFELEKRIITNEILIYKNQKTTQNRINALDVFFPEFCNGANILGEENDILDIEYTHLLKIYQETYRPENISLFVVGSQVEDEILSWVNQYFNEKKDENYALHQVQCILSDFKEKQTQQSNEKSNGFIHIIKFKKNMNESKFLLSASMELFFEILFGKTSNFYINNCEKGFLKNFNYEVNVSSEFSFVLLSGESHLSKNLVDEIMKTIRDTPKNRNINRCSFEDIRKNLIGKLMSESDSVHKLADILVNSEGLGIDVSSKIHTLKSISYDDVIQVGTSFLVEMDTSTYVF